MQLLCGVYPLLGPASSNTDELIELSLASAKDNNMIHEGDLVVILQLVFWQANQVVQIY
jgi:pyruvate kinase